MKKFIFATIAFLMLCGPSVYAAPLNLNQILEATARVGTIENYGSGTVVAEQNGKYFILTSAHVVGEADEATVEFFTHGSKTLPIKGTVAWRVHRRNTDEDFAMVTIPASSLSTWKPRIIPLIDYDYSVQSNTYVQSAGCPEARWPMAWEGRVTHDAGSRLIFTPPPTSGQSGAGLLVNVPNSRGELFTKVGGIITWRVGPVGLTTSGYDKANGAAIPIDKLYDAMAGKVSSPKTVPSNYSPVATAKTPVQSFHEYALGSDAKYYKVVVDNGEMEAINLPIGVKVIRWPAFEVRQPANPLFSAQNFNSFNNGYGFAGGYSFGAPTVYGENEASKVDALTDQVKLQKEQIDILNLEINTLRVEKQNLQAEIERLRSQPVPDTGKIQQLSTIVEDKESKIESLTEAIKVKDEALTVKAEEKIASSTEMERVRGQRNMLGLGTIVGFLSTIGIFIWKYVGRKQIGSILDGIEDKLQDKVDDKIDPDLVKKLREALDNLEEKIGDAIDKKIEATPSPVVNSKPANKSAVILNEKDYSVTDILDAIQHVSATEPGLDNMADKIRAALLKTK